MSRSTPFKHDKPDDSVGFLLWQLTSLWQSEIKEVLQPFGISQLQFAVLASLKWFEEHHQETTQAHIVEHAKIDKMSVSRALRKLEDAGWVERQQSKIDGRALGIVFTTQGIENIKKAIIAVEATDERFFSSFSEQELNVYKALTLSLIQARGTL